MKTSNTGITLIKEFEGCCLAAYKLAGEQYYTIGYGHYGADVSADMTITQEAADTLLKSDLRRFEANVMSFNPIYNFNQNEFDALVSFAYNVGSINQLTANGKRTRSEIEGKWLAYVKSNGKTLPGLVRRRKAELSLFKTKVNTSSPTLPNLPKRGYYKVGDGYKVYAGLKDDIRLIQSFLNRLIKSGLTVDGCYGERTAQGVKAFQKCRSIKVDGLWGTQCLEEMKEVYGMK